MPRLVSNLVMDLPLERLPDLVPCLVHTRYQMVLGAVAASERTASKGAGGMGEAFRYLFLLSSLFLLRAIFHLWLALR